MRVLILGILVALSFSTVARAQTTAEETAAFILLGLEGARTYHAGELQFTVHEVSSSPFVFDMIGDPKNGGTIRMSIQRKGDCIFESHSEDAATGADYGTETFNLANMLGASDNGAFVTITFKGECSVNMNGKCMNDYIVPFIEQAGKARLKVAIEYMRKTYCAGPAF